MVNGVRDETRLFRQRATACTALVVTIALFAAGVVRASAQIGPTTGQNIAPVFEGWERNPDGSFNLVFGYFNRNWDEEIDVPIGPNNAIEPGGPDQGQPTHFYPRRTRFLFRIRVPSDFGDKELVWTLTSNGKTERAYATRKPDYIIDNSIIAANNGEASGRQDNSPPVLKVEGEQVRHVKVGDAVTLTAVATDDGIPAARPMPPPPLDQISAIVPFSATGLRVSWFVYRGAGKVTFAPRQFNAWEDDRDGRDLAGILGLGNASGAAGQHVGRARDLWRSGDLCVARSRSRRGPLGLSGCDGHRNPLRRVNPLARFLYEDAF